MQFIQSSGPYGYLILILGLVNLGLVITRATQLAMQRAQDGPALQSRLHSILFWGGICAVLGLLGQATGLYNALRAIGAATEISPNIVMQGLAESFTTTLFGIQVFVASAIAWFALSARYRRRVADEVRPGPGAASAGAGTLAVIALLGVLVGVSTLTAAVFLAYVVQPMA